MSIFNLNDGQLEHLETQVRHFALDCLCNSGNNALERRAWQDVYNLGVKKFTIFHRKGAVALTTVLCDSTIVAMDMERRHAMGRAYSQLAASLVDKANALSEN